MIDLRDLSWFLKSAKKEFFLEFGQHKISPITQISSFILLKYIAEFKKEKNISIAAPFFYSFPNKKMASVWLSISLLTNFFYEDYIECEGKPRFDPEIGKKYLINKSVVQFRHKKTIKGCEKYIFIFRGENNTLSFEKNICSSLKNVSQNRSLNTIQHYKKSKRASKLKRTPISKILMPNEEFVINDEILESKILIIAGRGNTLNINKFLEEKEIDQESLWTIYSPNNNIIVRPDLHEYKSIFDKEYNSKFNKFIDWTKKLILETSIKQVDLSEKLKELLDLISNDITITSNVDNKFFEILEEFEEEPKLQKLKDLFYPGVGFELPKGLRAVIINDINQLEEYPETINGILRKKIPVIFVSNRFVEGLSDLTFYKRLFKDINWESSYRLNWNRKKIKSIIRQNYHSENYLDKELWDICLKYASQKIEIFISKEPEGLNLDRTIVFLQKQITSLVGFENLKSAFFDFLYPALYTFKNTNYIRKDSSINGIINSFMEVWDENKKYISDEVFLSEMDRITKKLSSEDFDNSKSYPEENLFVSTVPIPGHGELNIPFTIEDNLGEDINASINFTGFPYREYSGKFLRDSSLTYFVPQINIFCWPNEGNLTYNYLKRRIEAGYFIDMLPSYIQFPKELLIEGYNDVYSEIDDLLTINNLNYIECGEEFHDQENEISYIDNFRFEKFKSLENENDKFKFSVECNIIRFKDGSFMFLPHNSYVLGELEYDSGRNAIKRLKFDQLTNNLRIFKYDRNQINYSNLLIGNKEIEKAKKELDKWRETLTKLANNFDTLLDLNMYLLKIKNKNNFLESNPEINNLKRWFNDDDLIAPSESNVRLIIIGGIEKNFIAGNLDEIIFKIMDAFKFIKRTHISIGHQIKSAISVQLNNNSDSGINFSVQAHGIEFDIIGKRIVELQKSNIKIDYNNTRKFQC